MVRTQIQLTTTQAAALKRMSAERGVSMSTLVREAIEAKIDTEAASPRRQRALAAIGGFRSGKKDLGTNHDEYLAEDFA
jgi:hypothetical protein